VPFFLIKEDYGKFGFDGCDRIYGGSAFRPIGYAADLA
jgi:hypothetical protein